MKFDGFNERLKHAVGNDTTYAFAKKSGISEPLLRKYLSGASAPSVEKAWKMAIAARVSLDWLTGKKHGPAIDQSNNREPLSTDQKLQNLNINIANGVVSDFVGFDARLKRAMGADSPYAFAKKCEISESSLRRYLDGVVMPGIEKAWRMANTANVSLDWLADGRQFSDQVNQTASSSKADDVYVNIPLYDSLHLGRKNPWNQGAKTLTQLVFSAHSLRKHGVIPERLLAIRMTGDSMVGLLKDGDILMIDQDRNQLDADAVYLIRLSDQVCAKRLQRLLDGSVCIISENKAYGDVMVTKAHLNDLDIMGRVIWSCGWM